MRGPRPLAKLGDLMKRSTATVSILTETEYREVTVKLWGKGVVLRGVVSVQERRRLMAMKIRNYFQNCYRAG